MKKTTILLAVLLCTGSLMAQEYFKEQTILGAKIRIKNQPGWDGYTVGHLIGGMILYDLTGATGKLLGKKPGPMFKFWTATFLGFFYELYKDGLGNPIPLTGGRDHHGADFKSDWPAVVIGAVLGIAKEALIKIIKCKIYVINRTGTTVVGIQSNF